MTGCTELGSNISVRWLLQYLSYHRCHHHHHHIIVVIIIIPQYFSAALADSEHRIMLAEDAIGGNKTRARLGPPDIEPSYAHRSFR